MTKHIVAAVKMLFNFGVTTSRVKNFFETEYHALRVLPFHDHVVQLLSQFVAQPSQQMIDSIPPVLFSNISKEMFAQNTRTGVTTGLKSLVFLSIC